MFLNLKSPMNWLARSRPLKLSVIFSEGNGFDTPFKLKNIYISIHTMYSINESNFFLRLKLNKISYMSCFPPQLQLCILECRSRCCCGSLTRIVLLCFSSYRDYGVWETLSGRRRLMVWIKFSTKGWCNFEYFW